MKYMKWLVRLVLVNAILSPCAIAQETRFFSLFINNSQNHKFLLGKKSSSQFDNFRLFDPCVDEWIYGPAYVNPGESKWVCGGTTNNYFDGYANISIGVDTLNNSYWDTWDVNKNDDPSRIRIHDHGGNTKFDWVAKDDKDYKSIYTIYILNDDGSYSETMIKRAENDNKDLWDLSSNPIDLLKNICFSDSKGCSTVIHQ